MLQSGKERTRGDGGLYFEKERTKTTADRAPEVSV